MSFLFGVFRKYGLSSLSLTTSWLHSLFLCYLCIYIIHAYQPSCKIKIEGMNEF